MSSGTGGLSCSKGSSALLRMVVLPGAIDRIARCVCIPAPCWIARVFGDVVLSRVLFRGILFISHIACLHNWCRDWRPRTRMRDSRSYGVSHGYPGRYRRDRNPVAVDHRSGGRACSGLSGERHQEVHPATVVVYWATWDRRWASDSRGDRLSWLFSRREPPPSAPSRDDERAIALSRREVFTHVTMTSSYRGQDGGHALP